MKLFGLLVILGIFATASNVEAADDLFLPGPYAVQHKLYLSLFTWGLDHSVDVWAPQAEGTFPVVYFIPGIAGLIPAELYNDFCERVASHGYVVMGIWTLTALPMSQVKPTWLKEIDVWLQENLSGMLLDDDFNPGMVVDFSKIFIMGHSSGAHVTVNYLKLDNGCDNIRGQILLSPVDGLDPFGIFEEFCVEPGTKLMYETPTLLLSTGLDGLPGIGEPGSWYPACAPDNLSNLRFWDALNGEAWLVNATGYGHGDILWEFVADDVIGTLKNCATGESPIPVYHDFLGGAVVAFMKGVEGDCEILKYLEDSSWLPVDANTRKQEGGQATCQDGGYCIHL